MFQPTSVSVTDKGIMFSTITINVEAKTISQKKAWVAADDPQFATAMELAQAIKGA